MSEKLWIRGRRVGGKYLRSRSLIADMSDIYHRFLRRNQEAERFAFHVFVEFRSRFLFCFRHANFIGDSHR